MSVTKGKDSSQHLYNKRWIDIFTAGHFMFGFISYLIIFILLREVTYLLFDDALFCSLIGVMFVGLIWEFIENFILIRFRPNGADSLKNSLTDILFDLFGGIFAWIIVYFLSYFAGMI